MQREYFTMRYRIYPTPRQAQQIDNTLGACRAIHSAALRDMTAHYEHTGQIITPTLKDYQGEPHLDLNDIDPMALSHTLILLHKSFEAQARTGKYPPHPARKGKQSYSTGANGGRVSIEGKRLNLPSVGLVPIALHRPMPSQRPVNITITRNPSGSYYAAFLFARPYTRAQQAIATEENTLGLDFSVPKFYVDSNGDSPGHPRFYEKEEKRIEAIRRKLRRMVKGGKNYEKERQKLARLYERVANRRRDWLHKESRRLAESYDYIAVENLDLQGIAGLYQLGSHTLDNAYRRFLDILAYKMAWQGKGLIKINRWIRSSQKCHKCGYLKTDLTLSDRFWKCPKCGNHNSRDHNAAINIKNQVLKYKA